MPGESQSDLKQRSHEIRERILDLTAAGATRQETARQLGVPFEAVRYAVFAARAKGDPRAIIRNNRSESARGVYGLPRDLAVAFKKAAAARGLDHGQLRRRVLYVVLRDNLFDALDLDDPALKSVDRKIYSKARRQ